MRGGEDLGGGLPYDLTSGGVRLRVRLTPRAACNGLDGILRGADGRAALQLRVTAPPVKGAANAALIGYLANALKLRKSDIRIASGETARLKLLNLSGDADTIAARLSEWIAASNGSVS